MGIKNKVFGFVAAAALTLSMFGGVAAQSSDSVHGVVQVAGGSCKISIESASMNFGTWKYNGTSYDAPASGNSVTLEGNITQAKPNSHCKLNLKLTSFVSGSDSIAPNHFSANITGVNSGGVPSNGTVGPITVTGNSMSGSLTLVTIPADLSPGAYEGDLIATVTNGA